MNQVFLSHLWLEWRTLLGLPISKPYILAKGGHTRELKSEEFIEPRKE